MTRLIGMAEYRRTYWLAGINSSILKGLPVRASAR